MYSFEEFRAKISIAEIAEQLGYWKDPSGGQKYLCYCLGNKNNPTDEIIIYNPNISAKNTYFSRKGGLNDKGNLINFVENRLNKFTCSASGKAGVNEVLSKYLGSDFKVNRTSETYTNNNQTEQVKFNSQYWTPKPLNDTSKNYLAVRRKLSQSTINDFYSRLHIYTVGGNNHVGFPFRKPGQMEITNFELRNYFPSNNQNYKGFCQGGDKSESCWMANFVPFEKVTDIYAFESAIDAMSFYEIKGFSKETTAAFISTGGFVTTGQINSLKKVFPNVKWHCCYDNDATGNLFDITTACLLKGETCKVYNMPTTLKQPERMVHISRENGIEESFYAKDFSSKEYLEKNKLNNIEVIKPIRGKDWNELLKSYRSFNFDSSPTKKATTAINSFISKLNLQGYHQTADIILQNRNHIISSIYTSSNYELKSVPIVNTKIYQMETDLQLKLNNIEIIPEIKNLQIIDHSTQKSNPGIKIVECLKEKNIDIFKNMSAEDLKSLLEKKTLCINTISEKRQFSCSTSPSGWDLKEIFPIKKNDLLMENML